MNKTKQRLAVLERVASGPEALVCVQRYEGETDEQAILAHAAANGALPPRHRDLIVIVSKPMVRPASEGQ